MSWDIELIDENGNTVVIPRHEEGGTYVLGGTDRAELNITYNYSWFYFHFLNKKWGLRWLSGKKGKETISALEKAVKELGTSQYKKDYWAPTNGNAGYALNILLQWAKLHPTATFKVI